ncbi:hypothetical protein C7447_102687 [Tenacibaculum adriaticum]|uniref:Uncharacterized protein n=1 Tax=Tenacibaculum adriaticum TaxID=413713 RepID=A0A5S5DUA5_9FLAO|nr:hypothetical protein [Tenacibaculum adriaticum]TYP99365.1 hypothetical protein C7447_102687 [Tenacibaculum adriaticum]
MDVLDKYKKAWDNQPEDSQKVSKDDIYKMAHSRSSSIVKWIFIIGLLEFVIFQCSYFFYDTEKGYEMYKKMNLENFYIVTQIIGYAILLFFLLKFYKNYKSISTIDNTKNLMSKIIKTRKTVKHYVFFNLSYLFLVLTVVTVAMTNNEIEEIPEEKKIYIIIGLIVFGLILILLFWLFYQLLYGILLRKLNKNYKELAKLNELN